MEMPLLPPAPAQDQEAAWTVAEEDGLWLAKVRLTGDLRPIGYCGSRELAEAMASAIALQLLRSRLQHPWLTGDYPVADGAFPPARPLEKDEYPSDPP